MKEYDLLSFQHITASNMAMKHETTIIRTREVGCAHGNMEEQLTKDSSKSD